MTTSTTARPVRVPGPGALCATLPHLIGFTPSESLVLVWMTDGIVSLTQRIDVEALDAGPEILRSALQAGANHGPERVAVVIWSASRTPSPDDLDLITDALDHVAPGVDVLDVLHVDGQAWRSIMCDNPECCPPDGTPLDFDGAPIVELIADGRAPLDSREDVEASEPVPAGQAHTVPEEMTNADREEWRDQRCAAWAVLLDSTAQHTPDLLAGLAASLHDVRVRDVALFWVTALDDADDLRRAGDLLADVVRAAHPEDAAPALSCAALVSWLLGDGVRANLRTHAALTADPGYSLALLLSQSLASGLPPKAWRDSMASLDFATVRHGSGS